MPPETLTPASETERTQRINAVIRFAGDSGDGMQLAGTQFTDTSAVAGNDVATLPDYPAEIRAPAGTVAGVSGFQINFASENIYTPGDIVHALIAMNPAAFKAHIHDVEPGGYVIVNETEFSKTNLKKAGYPLIEGTRDHVNPLDDPELNAQYKIVRVPITKLNQEVLKESGLNPKGVNRCRNMWALGLVYWLFERPLDTTIKNLKQTFEVRKKMPEVAEANIRALRAGYDFGETAELFPVTYRVPQASIKPGKYRKITGNEALAMGLVTAGQLSKKDVIYCSYPITPASDILHYLAPQKHYGVKTFQAEDEIAACCAAIGASFAGQLAVTGTSGPGLALKGEAMGLAVMTELPLVVVNVQRGGPSTGLPTKTEQSDLLQAMFGRNGDCPMVVIAPQSPADCFTSAIEACRIAMQHMVPVLLLTDGYLANGSEPWPVPQASDFAPIEISHPKPRAAEQSDKAPDAESDFHPYTRDDNHARPWMLPGTVGGEHRLGGLEKQNGTGNVSYDPQNHQDMVRLRAEKVQKVADALPDLEVNGDAEGDLLVLGWGGPYGSITTAVNAARAEGKSVSSAQLRYLNPMPKNLGDVLKRFKKILIPELNDGQLRLLIRGKYLADARGLNKVQGKPFLVEEVEQAIELMLNGEWGDAEALWPESGQVLGAR
ncbi:2-oxoacid:acceptor oxidoreductase subunit alpha [Algisphaera agarilytica]|uniref:2-oxoglutarate ferredoxin oxidoreductase subunit alpha n=1 Tax=Algisphaera agarilytica TaxID=1385975 RepID=A0A7X0H7W7_9BACT|nr:2-oxoacid:acceptor oxidoreductase subunit alpha [Algisphaera agarilytica]MBB6430925.1 2-oxoglutarate ferredoxin oxidoreductase subunit alpha [Algisphaera agarilytica]